MKKLTYILVGMLLLVACQSTDPTPTSVAPMPATHTPTIMPDDTEIPLPPSSTATLEDLDPSQTPTVRAFGTAGSAGMDIQGTLEALSAMIAISTATPTPENQPTPANEFVPLFQRAWQIVDENYVRGNFNGVDWEAMYDIYLPRVEAATSQQEFWDLMVEFIHELGDDHSRFIPPNRFGSEFDIPELQEGGSSPHHGMIIWPAREDEYLFVWDVCGISPADTAGIKRGDIILAINGEPVERGEDGFDLTSINRALFAQGDHATITIQQNDSEAQNIDLQFSTRLGRCPGWQYGILSESPRIGYIRIPDFGNESDTNVWNFLQELEEDAPLDGLILDVRHNGGGNSDRDAAIFTEGTFGETGPLREDGYRTIVRIRGPVRWNTTTPMALLIDGNSHSAAEYFATYLQQSRRATIVGMPTAGNTEAITGYNLADGSVIRLAFQILILPDGSLLEEVGVQPDIRVPLEQWGLQEDVQLRAAYEAVLTKIDNP